MTTRIPANRPAVAAPATRPAERPRTIPQVAVPTTAPKPASTFRPAAVGEARPTAPTSTIEFNVHPGLDEIRRFSEERGWPAKGWKQVSVYGVDLVYTTDNWKTTRSLRSSEVPSPFVNGHFQMPDVPKGTTVEFAIKCYVGASDPHDIGGHRDRGEVWLNNGGRNYTQVSR